MGFEQLGTMSSRHRSPAFSKIEVKTLLNLIDKHKTILLNKSTTNSACHAKELMWAKITKIFNSKGFENKRNVDCLRGKWENLKREARRVSKNLLDVGANQSDELISQTVTMIFEAENNTSEVLVNESEIEDDAQLEEPEEGSVKNWKQDVDDEESYSGSLFSGGRISKRRQRICRSMNFTPQESTLLLKCVRAEKKYIFSKVNNRNAILLKNRAWSRVANSFNKQSVTKRSLNVLRTKFTNMKRAYISHKNQFSHVGNNAEDQHLTKFDEDNLEKIKEEPVFNLNGDVSHVDDDSEHEADVASNQNCENSNDTFHGTSRSNGDNTSPDPLSIIIKSDSGLGSLSTESCQLGKNEISKLKFELLKTKLENAKLEKKRIEDALRADASAHEARATEMELRLRAARLEAIAAASKLTHGHPALQYTPEEMRAKRYIDSYHQT